MQRVLILEDNLLAQIPACKIVKDLGFIADTAAYSDEAFKLLKLYNYDFVFTDIGLPKMNGFELTRQLRAGGYTMPIVALTVNNSEENRVKIKQYGLNDSMVKPLTFDKAKVVFIKFGLAINLETVDTKKVLI